MVAVGAKDGAVAEVGGNAPVYGPDKVAVGQPGGAHLGAHSDDLVGGLPGDLGREHRALLLHAVEVSDVRVDDLLAGDACIQHLGLALVHGVVLYLHHRALNGLGIGHVIHRLDGEEGNLLLHVEELADVDTVNVHIRVEGLQFRHAHVVVKGDLHEGVALLHLIGGLAVGVGGEGGQHGRRVLIDIGGGVLVGNVDPGGKLGGHCVFIYIGSLHLLQHPIQGLPILGRADELAVDGEHIALHYLANLVKEVGLKVRHGGDGLPLRQGRGVGHRAVHGIVVAQNIGGTALHPVHHILKHRGAGDGAQGHAVHLHHIAGSVDSAHHSRHADDHGGGQEMQGIDQPAAARGGGVQPAAERLHALRQGRGTRLPSVPELGQGRPDGRRLLPGRMQNFVHEGNPPNYLFLRKRRPARAER